MNILNRLRKPYLSLLLSLLILFISCSPSDEIQEYPGSNEVSLEIVVKEHINISKKIASVLTKEKKIDFFLKRIHLKI